MIVEESEPSKAVVVIACGLARIENEAKGLSRPGKISLRFGFERGLTEKLAVSRMFRQASVEQGRPRSEVFELSKAATRKSNGGDRGGGCSLRTVAMWGHLAAPVFS